VDEPRGSGGKNSTNERRVINPGQKHEPASWCALEQLLQENFAVAFARKDACDDYIEAMALHQLEYNLTAARFKDLCGGQLVLK
jgi:hypothetical protein